jgi:hypothetical protein
VYLFHLRLRAIPGGGKVLTERPGSSSLASSMVQVSTEETERRTEWQELSSGYPRTARALVPFTLKMITERSLEVPGLPMARQTTRPRPIMVIPVGTR